jgi:hypothetical protein
VTSTSTTVSATTQGAYNVVRHIRDIVMASLVLPSVRRVIQQVGSMRFYTDLRQLLLQAYPPCNMLAHFERCAIVDAQTHRCATCVQCANFFVWCEHRPCPYLHGLLWEHYLFLLKRDQHESHIIDVTYEDAALSEATRLLRGTWSDSEVLREFVALWSRFAKRRGTVPARAHVDVPQLIDVPTSIAQLSPSADEQSSWLPTESERKRLAIVRRIYATPPRSPKVPTRCIDARADSSDESDPSDREQEIADDFSDRPRAATCAKSKTAKTRSRAKPALTAEQRIEQRVAVLKKRRQRANDIKFESDESDSNSEKPTECSSVDSAKPIAAAKSVAPTSAPTDADLLRRGAERIRKAVCAVCENANDVLALEAGMAHANKTYESIAATALHYYADSEAGPTLTAQKLVKEFLGQ